MIAKYRNRSVYWVIAAISLSVLLVVVFWKMNHQGINHRNDGLFVLVLVLYFAAWTTWVMTSLSLARAKGWSRDVAGTLFLLFFIIGFCFPIAQILFPFYIIFAMEDKTKSKMRRHRQP